jgi:hypothetical protein
MDTCTGSPVLLDKHAGEDKPFTSPFFQPPKAIRVTERAEGTDGIPGTPRKKPDYIPELRDYFPIP